MLLKQHVQITARLFAGYAHLRYTISFYNADSSVLAPAFDFALPQGAVLAGFQVFLGDRRLLRTCLVPAADAPRPQAGFSSAVLRRTGMDSYTLFLSRLPAEGTVKLIAAAYLPLPPDGRTVRLVIPNPAAQADVEVEVMDHQAVFSLSSPTHTLHTDGSRAVLSSGTLSSDIVIEAVYCRTRQNIAYFMRLPSDEVLGYYQLSLPKLTDPKPADPCLFFLLDCTPGMLGGRLAAAKDAILAVLQACGAKQRFQIAALGRQAVPFHETDLLAATENLRSAADWLQGIRTEGGIISEPLKALAPQLKKPDVIPILLTSADLHAWAQLVQLAGGVLAGTGLNLVTFGARQPDRMAAAAAAAAGGRSGHLFPQQGFEQEAVRLISAFLRPNPQQYDIRPAAPFGGELFLCPDTGGAGGQICSVIVKGTMPLPQRFILSGGQGAPALIEAEEAAWFEGFELLRLLYGEARMRELKRLQCTASPASWRSIRQQIQRVSLESGLLSEETVFAIQWESAEGSAAEPIPCRIEPDRLPRLQEFTDRASRFLSPETAMAEPPLCIPAEAAAVLLLQVRADGAIADAGVCDPQERIRQTAYALAALCKALQGRAAYRPILADAAAYLLAQPFPRDKRILQEALRSAVPQLRGTAVLPRVMAALRERDRIPSALTAEIAADHALTLRAAYCILSNQ